MFFYPQVHRGANGRRACVVGGASTWNPPPPSTFTTYPPKPRPLGTPLPFLFPLSLKSACPVRPTPSGIVLLRMERSHWPRRVDSVWSPGGRGPWCFKGRDSGGGHECNNCHFDQFDGSRERTDRWLGPRRVGHCGGHMTWQSHRVRPLWTPFTLYSTYCVLASQQDDDRNVRQRADGLSSCPSERLSLRTGAEVRGQLTWI